jgi:membrane-bound serine protease (ClpP class)
MQLHRGHATSLNRRVLRRAGALLLLAVGVLFLVVPASDAASERDQKAGITVVQVEGLLDPPLVSLVLDAIEQANADAETLLVLQLDSNGAVADVHPVVRAIRRSRVPIAVWVGPSGAETSSGAVLVAEAAPVLYVAQGSDIGPAHPTRRDEPDASTPTSVAAELDHVVAAGTSTREFDAHALATNSFSPTEAKRAGVIDGIRPTVGEVIVTLDGTTVHTASGAVKLSTATVIGHGRDRRRQPNQAVLFRGLTLGGQIQHGLISPSLAYSLIVIGLALIVFEFFAASIGFAALVGATCALGAMYGFSHLPIRWWGLALLFLSALGFAIDAQAGGLGFWTAVGGAALVAGSLTLYEPASDLRPSWWMLVLVIAGTVLFYVWALPTFLRARFSTPTMGREGMVGELGTAEVAVDPEGVVLIRGARWRARTNRATPIATGDAARVVAVEGLVLEVEPESGGARDYRERRSRSAKK